MSQKQKNYDAMVKTLQGWIDKSTEASEFENQLTGQYNKTRNWLDKRDFLNPMTGQNIDMHPLAEAGRESKYGDTRSGGTVAHGANNGGALNVQNDVANNALTNDWAHLYEGNAANTMNQNQGLAGTLQGLYSGRMNAGVQGAQMQLQNILNRPKGFDWMQLVGMGISAAPSIISAI